MPQMTASTLHIEKSVRHTGSVKAGVKWTITTYGTFDKDVQTCGSMGLSQTIIYSGVHTKAPPCFHAIQYKLVRYAKDWCSNPSANQVIHGPSDHLRRPWPWFARVRCDEMTYCMCFVIGDELREHFRNSSGRFHENDIDLAVLRPCIRL